MIVSQPSSENRLLAEILRVQKTFKLFRRNQFPQKLFLHFNWNWLRLDKLLANLLANPKLLFLALNVAIFDADFAAVSAAQDVENLAQSGDFMSGESAS